MISITWNLIEKSQKFIEYFNDPFWCLPDFGINEHQQLL